MYLVFGLIFTAIFANTRQDVWEGEFQIVLDGAKTSNSNLLPDNLSSMFGRMQLNTEVGILKSPSVLIDIFEYVKSQDKSRETLRFNAWRNTSINIDLKKILVS